MSEPTIKLNRVYPDPQFEASYYRIDASEVDCAKLLVVGPDGKVGVSSFERSGFVTSVAGRTGDIVLTHSDIKDWDISVRELISRSNYVLPIASASILGGVKVGKSLKIDGDGTLNSTNYEYSQSSPAARWTIAHGMQKFPSVSILTEEGVVVYGKVTHLDENTLTIDFVRPFSGTAYLN